MTEITLRIPRHKAVDIVAAFNAQKDTTCEMRTHSAIPEALVLTVNNTGLGKEADIALRERRTVIEVLSLALEQVYT